MHYEGIQGDRYKYIKRVHRHMTLLDTVFEKMNIFDTRCEYISECALYKEDSFMCTKELDKYYCGVYKQFLQKD